MKAIIYTQTGPAQDVLQLVDLPVPEPGDGEVRVRLHYSGVNPSDVKRRGGSHHSALPFSRQIPHSDGAGEIDQVGAGVPTERIGQRVWVWNAAFGRPDGTAAEYVVLPQEQAVVLPDDTSLAAGACFGIPAMTAMHAVLGYGGVEGKSVLVTGGAGAVGHYAIQFCRLLGASRVLSTVSSSEKALRAIDAGADAAINYRDEDVARRVKELTNGEGVDRVIEVDISANGLASTRSLKRHGQMVVYGCGGPGFELPFLPLIASQLALHFFLVYDLANADRAAAQATLTRLLTEGKVRHQVGDPFPLSKTVEAHHLVESGRASGNVLLALP